MPLVNNNPRDRYTCMWTHMHAYFVDRSNFKKLYRCISPQLVCTFNKLCSSKYMSRSLNITTTENTLTVYHVTSSDVGTYTCNASNIFGSVVSSGILTVASK